MRLNYDYTVTPRMIVHAGVGYIMYRNPDVALSSVLAYDAPGQLGLQGGIPNNFTGTTVATGFPRLTALSTGGYGMSLNMGPANANKYAIDKPTAVLNTSYVTGNHSFKVGADWRIDAYRDRNVRGTQGIWNFSNNETADPYIQSRKPWGRQPRKRVCEFPAGVGRQRQRTDPARSPIPEDVLVAFRAGYLEGHPQADVHLRRALGSPGRGGRNPSAPGGVLSHHAESRGRRTYGSDHL